MKKRILTIILAGSLVMSPLTVFADNVSLTGKIVTLGANLSSEQRSTMLNYFNAGSGSTILEVDNTEERKFLEGIATEEQIGTRTYSCILLAPKERGGIDVKTANLTWVTSDMIASTLTTAGITNCEVVAAAPMPVSGTGALTGIFKAYEEITGEPLDTTKKQLATDELYLQGTLKEDYGEAGATLITDAKTEVLEKGLTGADVEQAVKDAAAGNKVELSTEDLDRLTKLMKDISEQGYNYEDLKDTLNKLQGKVDDVAESLEDQKNWFAKFLDRVIGVFSSSDKAEETESGTLADDSILKTDDSILGDNVKADSTNTVVEDHINKEETQSESESESETDGSSKEAGLLERIAEFFNKLVRKGQ